MDSQSLLLYTRAGIDRDEDIAGNDKSDKNAKAGADKHADIGYSYNAAIDRRKVAVLQQADEANAAEIDRLACCQQLHTVRRGLRL